MFKLPLLDRLYLRLTAALLLASILGVALVALLAYRSTSSDFNAFLRHMEDVGPMFGGGMMEGMGLAAAAGDFLDNLGRTLWIAGLSGVALALFLGSLLTRQIVAPLSRVTAAARRVAQGDLEQNVAVRGSGELAELGKSFNLMAANLRHDQKLRQNIIADIAHELRTPLSILQGNVEAMLDGVLPADSENLTSLHQETMLLTRLVDDLRTLSLAEAGQLKFHLSATDLKSLTARAIDGLQTQLSSNNISVAIEAVDNIPPAQADPDRTAQVLRNLLNNALQYTPQGGRIRVQLATEAEGIMVSVVDNGPGIPHEDLPHIFDRFYRVDRSRTRSTGGSGLGLTIVKQLVEAQGGSVWADSIMGKGSTFSFRLPYSTP